MFSEANMFLILLESYVMYEINRLFTYLLLILIPVSSLSFSRDKYLLPLTYYRTLVSEKSTQAITGRPGRPSQNDRQAGQADKIERQARQAE